MWYKSPVIKPVKGGMVPSLCVFIDTETHSQASKVPSEEIQTFRLAAAVKVQRIKGVWRRRGQRRFQSGSDLWNWIHELESFRRPVWIFGHNVGFDLTISNFWDHVDEGEWSIRDVWPSDGDSGERMAGKRKAWRGTVVVTDPPTFLVLRSKTGSIRIVDTFNYFHGALSELGDSIGTPQLDKGYLRGDEESAFLRCERDCEILERTVCGWIDRWSYLKCGNWKPTAAGLGYSAWRATIGSKKIVADKSEQQIEWSRSAYYGGQVEVFYQGSVYPSPEETISYLGMLPPDYESQLKGPVTHFDVHALYPHVMKQCLYPCKFVGWQRDRSIDRLIERSKYELPIASVWLSTGSDTYPVRRSGAYMHATGRFHTFLCGEELKGALARGHVCKIGDVAWYEPMDLFSEFTDKWIALRRDDKEAGMLAWSVLDKLVVNSLSGKFAQHKTVWKDRPDMAAKHRFGEWNSMCADTGKLLRFRAIGGNVQQHFDAGESKESFPAISAHIAANGREYMRQFRLACPPRSVLYMDTDSLIVLPQAAELLRQLGFCDQSRPGSLNTVGIYTWIDILGFKYYATPKGVVCPGLKKDSAPISIDSWRQDVFQRLPHKLNTYDGATIRVRKVEFTPVGTLGNRQPSSYGWTVAPRLPQDPQTPF